MLGKGFSNSLGQTLGKVLARGASGLTYVKDNLKIYFDFKSTRAKTLEFVGTGSAYFSGTNAKVVVSDDDSLDIGTNSFSVSAWIYHTADSTDYIVNKMQNSSNNPGWRMYKHSNNKLFFAVQDTDADDGSYVYGDEVSPVTNSWHYVVATVDRSIETSNYAIKLYVNGIDSGNAKGGVTLANVGTSDNSGDLIIGESYSGGNDYIGNIKNVGYWKRVLSPAEIQNIMYKNYSDLKGSELTHLLGWWALESDANDSTGNNNGTATNVTFNSTNYAGGAPIKPRGFDNAPTAQADLIGSGSASFDGSGEYVDCGTGLPDVTSGAFTIVGWYKLNNVSAVHTLFSRGAGTSAHGYMLKYDTTPRLMAAQSKTGGYNYITYNYTFLANTWYHIAWVNAGTGNASKIYLDGVLATTETESQDILTASDKEFKIGSDYGGSNELDGNAAQVGWFSAVLTQEQIQSISQKTYDDLSSSEKTNLVSWWGLDVNANDEHGSNNGTLT